MPIADRYGPFSDRDAPFTRRCRLLQSWYRVEVLGISECGPWQKGARPVGSSLVDGDVTGANLLTPEAFAYAKQRVADKKDHPDLTIDEFRLFNNMLSSMPMCFNLFADFRAAVHAGCSDATTVLAAIFRSSPIEEIQDVIVEMIPTPVEDYIDDKTAFDAAIFFVDPQGQPGLASIETKYTDKLGKNPAAKQDKKFALARELSLFTNEGFAWHEQNGFDQVARNLLLTLAYAKKHGLVSAINYVLAPEQDSEAPMAVDQLRERLAPDYRDRIKLLTLERVVQRGLSCADGSFANHLNRFHKRYLDFGQIAHL